MMEMFYSSELTLDQILFILKKTSIDNKTRYKITLTPVICLVSNSGSAAHAKKVVTSIAICSTDAFVGLNYIS